MSAVGRRLFGLTSRWGGHHPIGCPADVVNTHSAPVKPEGGPQSTAQGVDVTRLRYRVRYP